MLDSAGHKIVMRPHPRCRPELGSKMHRRQTSHCCHICKRNTRIQSLIYVLNDPAQAPVRQRGPLKHLCTERLAGDLAKARDKYVDHVLRDHAIRSVTHRGDKYFRQAEDDGIQRQPDQTTRAEVVAQVTEVRYGGSARHEHCHAVRNPTHKSNGIGRVRYQHAAVRKRQMFRPFAVHATLYGTRPHHDEHDRTCATRCGDLGDIFQRNAMGLEPAITL